YIYIVWTKKLPFQKTPKKEIPQKMKEKEENFKLYKQKKETEVVIKTAITMHLSLSLIPMLITIVQSIRKIVPALVNGYSVNIYGESEFGISLGYILSSWFIPLTITLAILITLLIKKALKIENLNIYYIIPVFAFLLGVIFLILSLKITGELAQI
ncbi:MAG: hypothetical protein ACTSQE_06390, partial [Candidatus Heimdallarchaeaceae archaeon]